VVEGAGYLFKPSDAFDLADRLRFLMANPAVRAAAGRTARKRIEQEYLWPEIATQIEQVYSRILGKPVAAAVPVKPNARAAAVGSIVGRRAS